MECFASGDPLQRLPIWACGFPPLRSGIGSNQTRHYLPVFSHSFPGLTIRIVRLKKNAGRVFLYTRPATDRRTSQASLRPSRQEGPPKPVEVEPAIERKRGGQRDALSEIVTTTPSSRPCFAWLRKPCLQHSTCLRFHKSCLQRRLSGTRLHRPLYTRLHRFCLQCNRLWNRIGPFPYSRHHRPFLCSRRTVSNQPSVSGRNPPGPLVPPGAPPEGKPTTDRSTMISFS